MFCSKCGKELPEGAAFCASCGNPTGATAPKTNQNASLNGMPPILGNLVKRVVGFFTGARQEAVVADSVKDTTWSGAILAGVGILVFIFTQLLNSIHFVRSFLQLMNYDYGEAQEAASENAEIWAAFGFSALFAVVYAGVLVGGTFLMVKMLKGNLTFLNVVNVAAYASLPVIAVSILNLVVGFIWGLLPVILFAAAVMASLYLIYRAVSDACGAKNAFLPYTITSVLVMIVLTWGAYVIFTAAMGM